MVSLIVRPSLVATGAERDGTLVVGAGPLAREVARLLTGPVVLVDRNADNAARAERAGLAARVASALDADALREAGAPTACYFVGLTANPALNASAADVARGTFGVPHVLVPDLAGRSAAEAGDDVLFGAGFALQDWDYHAARGDVRVEEGPHVPGRALVPTAGRLPVALRRDGRVLPYFPGLGARPGDAVLSLVRTGPEADPSRDRFEALVRTCPVLDLDGPLPMVMFFDRVGQALASRVGVTPDRLATLLMKREADANTVILPGLAIPHVVVPGEGRFEMAAVRARDGIAFPEQAPVHAAFVLLSSADERAFHLRTLAAVAHAVQREGFEDAWRDAPDADALRALLLAR